MEQEFMIYASHRALYSICWHLNLKSPFLNNEILKKIYILIYVLFNCITSRPSSGTRSHPAWCHTNINKKPLFWRTLQCKPRENRWLQKHIWRGHENNTVILVSLIDMASVCYQPNCCQWKAGSFWSALKNHKAFALLMFRESFLCM